MFYAVYPRAVSFVAAASEQTLFAASGIWYSIARIDIGAPAGGRPTCAGVPAARLPKACRPDAGPRNARSKAKQSNWESLW